MIAAAGGLFVDFLFVDTAGKLIRFGGRHCDVSQRASGAPQIRDRSKLRVCNGPGSAAHHFVLRCSRDTNVRLLRR
jgi:hypothetical protein